MPAGNGAFIARNSWGPDYGNAAGKGGYFYISYYDTSLGGLSAVYEVPESSQNYSKQYSHDILGNVLETGCANFDGEDRCSNQKSAQAANIFRATSNGKIKAVSFYTTDSNAAYSISVYRIRNTLTDISELLIE